MIPNTEHDCLFYVPKEAVEGKRPPILIALPGHGVSAQEDIELWRESAETTGLFLIDLDVDYLTMQTDTEIRKLQHRILTVVGEADKTYDLDDAKIYIAGTSGGGAIALALALRYPDKYESVGIVSGGRFYLNTRDHLDSAAYKRFFIVHGEKDESIPIEEAEEVKESLESHHAVVKFVKVPAAGHVLPDSVYGSAVRWIYPRSFWQRLKKLF